MTKFKIGDKVRILDVDRIYLGYNYWRNGDITEVVGYHRGAPWLKRTIDGRYGDLQIHADELRYIELVDGTSARLTEAEAEIVTLKAKVAALEKAERSVTIDGEKVGRIVSESASRVITVSYGTKSPNQRRADVIKRAQAFVADLEMRAKSFVNNRDGNCMFNGLRTYLTFHVNAKKGVVTALAKYYDGEVVDRAFANCAPGDVFNADIGMAIAAGRLYGVDIPKEFTDAPKPTKLVEGHVVTKIDGIIGLGKITKVTGGKAYQGKRYWQEEIASNETLIGLDDTDAVYS